MNRKRLKNGSYSEIKLINLLKNDIYVEKIYGKKTVISTQFAPTLFKRFLDYKKKAIDIGLPMCNTTYDRVINGLKNSYIVELQSYISINFEDFIRSTQDIRLLTVYIEKYIKFFKKNWESGFVIGVDPSVRNFGIDSDGELKYFDFFPPHQKNGQNEYFIWPDPAVNDMDFFIRRYFTKAQVQVIYAQIIRHLASRKIISPDEIKQILVKILGKSITEYINISSHQLEQVLSAPSPHSMDIVRFVAGELCFAKKISPNQLSMIYKNTHINSSNMLVPKPQLQFIINLINKSR